MSLTLEQARMMRKMSREKVAKEINVSPITIFRWENGDSYPDVVQFKKLCELYGCPMDSIYFALKSN